MLRKAERQALHARIYQVILQNPTYTAAELAPRFGVPSKTICKVAENHGIVLPQCRFFSPEEKKKLPVESNIHWGNQGQTYKI